ncbi:DUF6431 domain-containing protein [Clostridium sp. DJ247]|uniref:DUF6431 domain-containing protein n=1 Tax=Clostridium sp. DJ247 TaxID=2726188 RepID=UPI0037C0704E
MIIDFNVNYNNYNEKILNNYSIFYYICPKCGAKHSLTRHGNHERNVCFIDDSQNVRDRKIIILRVKCSSCNSTHAILPNDIIPYCIYSFSFILNVLTEYYSNEHRVLDICSKFSISFQILYMFILKFSLFLNSCTTVLRSLGYAVASAPNTIVSEITNYQFNGNFLYQHFFNSQWIFLMLKFQNILPRPIYIGGFY